MLSSAGVVLGALKAPRNRLPVPKKLVEVETRWVIHEATWPSSVVLGDGRRSCLEPEGERDSGPAGCCRSTWPSGPLAKLVTAAGNSDSRTNSLVDELCS